MVAEQAFLAPRLPVESAMTAASLAAGTVAVVGEVGGLAVRSCNRRLKATRHWEGLASSAPVTPNRSSDAGSPSELLGPNTGPVTGRAELRIQEAVATLQPPPGIRPVEEEVPDTALSRASSERQEPGAQTPTADANAEARWLDECQTMADWKRQVTLRTKDGSPSSLERHLGKCIVNGQFQFGDGTRTPG